MSRSREVADSILVALLWTMGIAFTIAIFAAAIGLWTAMPLSPGVVIVDIIGSAILAILLAMVWTILYLFSRN